MKSQNSKKQPKGNIGFAPPGAFVNLVDRDYGLMRVTREKSSTPYPKKSKGVDLDVVRERFEELRKSRISDISSPPEKSAKTNIQFDRDSKLDSGSEHPEKLPAGTPHPQKGMAVDPKLLRKTLEEEAWGKPFPQHWPIIKRLSSIQTLYADKKLDEKSIQDCTFKYSKKKQKHLPSSLRTRLNTDNYESNRLRKGKQVRFIAPKRVQPSLVLDSSILMSSTDERYFPSSDFVVSFHKRRKLFDEAEYTIARHGKKMSEQLMPESSKPVGADESMSRADQQARDQIESYIKKHGLMKVQAGTITAAVRSKDSVLSMHSRASSLTGKTDTENSLYPQSKLFRSF